MGYKEGKRLTVITASAAAVLFSAGCYRASSPTPVVETRRYGEDEFAARAAAIQKTCELAAVYVGRDDARAASLVAAAREETIAAMRGAPDPWRGALFAAAYARLDKAAFTLEGARDYNLPLSASEAESIRRELVAAAADLTPVAHGYYETLAGRYEGPGRRRTEWGPRAPDEASGPAAVSDVAPKSSSLSEPPPGGEGPAPTAAEGP